MRNFLYKKSQRDSMKFVQGFTLIESLVAIFIFSLAIVALMTVVSRGIAGTTAASLEATAHFLAQEGLEAARATRDDNFLNGTTFNRSITDCTIANPCGVDAYNVELEYTCANSTTRGGDEFCRLYDGDNMYISAAANPTPFARRIYLEGASLGAPGQRPMPQDMRIVSEVIWTHGSREHSVALETYITPWLTTAQ